MNNIQLHYVKNIISRRKGIVKQQLTFFIALKNIGFDKTVDVLWAGEDGEWKTLSAKFQSSQQQDKEFWLAHTEFSLSPKQSLPGNIQFALRLQVAGKQYWDNNDGLNYTSEADSGIRVLVQQPVLHFDYSPSLKEESHIPVIVGIDKTLAAEKVFVHWTTDNWQHSHKSTCHFRRDYWNKVHRSNARNPNQYGIQIWHGQIKAAHAFRVQYYFSAESRGNIYWDTNDGHNYHAQHKPLKLMILNLHCYQEDHQDAKFSIIARAIAEQQVDIICFQEVAENWNNGEGDWNSNSAKIINDRLPKPYHLYADWSHLGFDKYREGVAILSRYPMSKKQSRYVSESDDIYNIHSRKVVAAQIRVPYIGPINVFSVHLSWWEDGFKQQFEKLRRWAEAKKTKHTKATLLCGDFNIAAGSDGYREIVNTHEYEDQYLAANAHGLFEQIFRVNDAHWQNLLADDYRIDYVFMSKDSCLSVISAQVIFTEQDYGRVSDHVGYLMAFEPK